MAPLTRPSRRQFAGSAAAVVVAGFAGCTGDGLYDAYSSQPENTPVGEGCEREHQEASDLGLWNRHSEAHVVSVVVTGVREDGTSEPVYEESFDLDADQKVSRDVVFDPDQEDIERYEDYVARATTEDGQTDSSSIYSTVVSSPIRSTVDVSIEPDGELVVTEMHGDSVGWTPPC